MALVRKFVWGTDTEHGHTGWMPEHMPNFDALGTGYGMAHDILEHFSATDDSIEGEFMAFGSMLYLRAEPDYWGNIGARYTNPAQQMSGDVASFLCNQVHRERIRPATARKLDEEMEAIIEELIAATLREADGMLEPGTEMDRMEADLTNAVQWMRIGYRKAAKRWGMEPQMRLSMFYNVERACDDIIRDGDGEERCDGDVLTVSVDMADGNTRMSIKSIWDATYD